MKTKEILRVARTVNEAVIKADEQTCKSLMEAELRGRRRLTVLFRIHSRLNKLRAARERLELAGKVQTLELEEFDNALSKTGND